MRAFLRAFLSALAVLSTTFVCVPASAGLVATPAPVAPATAAREAALGLLESRLSEGGVLTHEAGQALRGMPDSDLFALAVNAESLRTAGFHGVAIAAAVLLVLGCCCGVWYWWDHDHGHHHRHHCGR
jgi:hypothetical protein